MSDCDCGSLDCGSCDCGSCDCGSCDCDCDCGDCCNDCTCSFLCCHHCVPNLLDCCCYCCIDFFNSGSTNSRPIHMNNQAMTNLNAPILTQPTASAPPRENRPINDTSDVDIMGISLHQLNTTDSSPRPELPPSYEEAIRNPPNSIKM